MAKFRTHIREAIRLMGSQQKLARAIGCSQQHISYLLKDAVNVSAETALQIDAVTSGAVSKADLRPDLWQREGAAA